eukprot:5077984-Amphidinium_carterae.1
MRAKAVILHDALHERVAVNGEGLGSVAVVDEGFFIGVEHPQAENNDGRVGSHEGGMAVRRWVPGKIDGETFFDADITSYFLPGYSLTLYLDNHHSDLPIEIKGVDIIVQDLMSIDVPLVHGNRKHPYHLSLCIAQPTLQQRVASCVQP